ncbi:MAG: ABC transporter permease [Anaerolineae bacterium]
MRRHLRLVWCFVRISAAEDMAHRANFAIGIMNSLLALATGWIGISVLFGQVQSVNGWGFAQTLSVLGVYLTAEALRGLFMSPSLDALAGMGGEVWTGRFDFTLLQPRDTQFLASFRRWRLLSLLDLVLGGVVLAVAAGRLGQVLRPATAVAFLVALGCGVVILYAMLLTLAALVFWGPGFFYTWIFDSVYQLARYPMGVYPGWLRLVLTWLIPVGTITTVPASALSGDLTAVTLLGAVLLAAVMFVGASLLFRRGLRRYNGATS